MTLPMRTRSGTRRVLARPVSRGVLMAGGLLSVSVLGLASMLVLWGYPGKPTPFLDEHSDVLPGSIAEKTFVTINGVQQGMFIKGKDVRNPVLLYVHGGMPDYFLTQKYPTGLEDYFTVVWWEQRGAGLSYRPDMPREMLTPEQLVSDTVAVTNYLRNRFGQDRIYLMAHSGGTFVGIQAAARATDLY